MLKEICGSYPQSTSDTTLNKMHLPTLLLWQRFKQEIQQQSLTTVWDLESELLPILIKMRQRGVRVQVEQAESLKAEMLQQEKKLLLDIKKLAGIEVDIWKARNIALAFDKLRIDYPRTEKSKEPSFTKLSYLTRHIK